MCSFSSLVMLPLTLPVIYYYDLLMCHNISDLSHIFQRGPNNEKIKEKEIWRKKEGDVLRWWRKREVGTLVVGSMVDKEGGWKFGL